MPLLAQGNQGGAAEAHQESLPQERDRHGNTGMYFCLWVCVWGGGGGGCW